MSFSVLVQALRTLADLPESEVAVLKTAIRECQLAPGARMSPRNIGFVIQGLLRAYYPDARGRERTMTFWAENTLTYSLGATRATPGSRDDVLDDWTVEAVEPTHVFTLSLEALDRLYCGHSCWNHIGRVFWQQAFREKMLRERAFLTLSATERYQEFLREHPGTTDRVPQYLVASYLGITPVALSRLRGRKTKAQANE